MTDKLQVDDILQVIIRTYEKYLSDEEVKRLIGIANAKNASKPVTVPADLEEKLDSLMPSIQSEIMGGCVQIGLR